MLSVVASLLLSVSSAGGTPAGQAMVASERAQLLVEQGQFETAEAVLDGARKNLPADAHQGQAAAAIASARGDLARARGDLQGASHFYQQAVEWLRPLGAAAAGVADPLRNLGTVAAIGGDLEKAEHYYQRSLQAATAAGNDTAAARVLNNLGIVAVRRGNISDAEVFYQRALAINERLGAWRSHYINLYNLADIADARGDLEAAITLLRRSLAGFENLGEDGPRVAQTRSALADLLVEAGLFEEAGGLFNAALAGYERLAPNSPNVTLALMGLGNAAQKAGDLTVAEQHYREVLMRRQAVSSASVETAQAYQKLAEVYLQREEFAAAGQYFSRARRVYEKLAPGSIELAATYYGLAKIAGVRADTDYALELHELAIDAVEAQTRKLGGAHDARSLFGDKYAAYYKDYIELLLDGGYEAQAFSVLERYRARSIIALLAERDFSSANEIPAALQAQRARWQKEYDAAQRQLLARAGASAADSELQALRSRMTEIRTKRDGLSARIRAAAGRANDRWRPVHGDINMAARALEEGTVALSYSVHADHTVLFVLAADAFRTIRIPVAEAQLREQVRRFRFLIESGGESMVPSQALLDTGIELYDLLIRPALLLSDADRLLIIPDGPLHTLPFAALVDGKARSASHAYLVEQMPLHKAQSVTLYAQLQVGAGTQPDAATVVLFGNAHEPHAAEQLAVDTVRSAGNLQRLAPLPFVDQEIDAINAEFAATAAVFSGAQATEQNVMRAAPGATYLHFATHSVVNEQVPLDSALVLHQNVVQLDDQGAGQDNGLLQAWEIFDQLRTEASLVVLSACETALGMETAGDGLIGLTRAFHYAGARSVVASQWRVSDSSTAQLMAAFYRELVAGVGKDDALRAAQLSLLEGRQRPEAASLFEHLTRLRDRHRNFRHPYFWAAFELSGARL